MAQPRSSIEITMNWPLVHLSLRLKEAIKRYYEQIDGRHLAHRGLQRELIPGWIRAQEPYLEKLDNFAYGDTPDSALETILARARREDRFLDLGCGCGRVVLLLKDKTAKAQGVDLNPILIAVAREAAEHLGVEVTFECQAIEVTDFQSHSLIYLAATRFTPELMQAIANKFHESPPEARLITVSQPLPGWTVSERWSVRFSWGGPREESEYPFFLHERS